MDFLESLKTKASSLRKRIVYPEGEDSRILQAAVRARDTGLCVPTLLGNQEKVAQTARTLGLGIDGIEVMDPTTSSRTRELADLYHELRKAKGISMEEAQEDSRQVMNFGALLVKRRLCDGMVAGAVHTTAETLRSAIRIVGTAE